MNAALLERLRETPDEGSVTTPGHDTPDMEPRLHAVREGLAKLIHERQQEIQERQSHG